LALFLVTLGPVAAGATTILSPVAAPVNTVGEWGTCCDIGNAFDQSGLSLGFTSGVTDFDVYMASSPMHSFNYLDQEFIGPEDVLSGTIVLDLGASFLVDRLAFWNEDATGVAEMTVSTSDDPNFVVGVTDHGTFFPTDNPYTDPGTDYAADVFALYPAHDRYVRLDITCPDTSLNTCGIGEIAFSAIPEPTTALLLGLGMAGLAVRGRRPRTS
jgi:hypothetical protein